LSPVGVVVRQHDSVVSSRSTSRLRLRQLPEDARWLGWELGALGQIPRSSEVVQFGSRAGAVVRVGFRAIEVAW